MTRLVCISDTHTTHDTLVLPAGDVLVHAGDWCGRGERHEAEAFAVWLAAQPHEHKVVIAGNHDWVAEKEPQWTAALFALHGVNYLCDRAVTVAGLRFYGSPWQPEFCGWAFNLPRRSIELAARWDAIPDDVDVLLTHGPPRGILDRCPTPQGCDDLAERLDWIRPLVHIFGHIHEGAGAYCSGRTMFVNAATCTGSYAPTNPPIVVGIEHYGPSPGFAWSNSVSIDKLHMREP